MLNGKHIYFEALICGVPDMVKHYWNGVEFAQAPAVISAADFQDEFNKAYAHQDAAYMISSFIPAAAICVADAE